MKNKKIKIKQEVVIKTELVDEVVDEKCNTPFSDNVKTENINVKVEIKKEDTKPICNSKKDHSKSMYIVTNLFSFTIQIYVFFKFSRANR